MTELRPPETGGGTPPQGPDAADGHGDRPHARALRLGLFGLSVIVVACAALLVPMPLSLTAPGGAVEVAPLLAVESDTTALSGELALLTVLTDQPSFVETVAALLDDDQSLDGRESLIPPTIDHRTYIELQQQEFRRSFLVAAAVGVRAAGHEVRLRTAPQVVGVLPGGPADGILQPGDVVRAYRGDDVTSIDQVVSRAEGIEVGMRLPITVDRDGELLEVTVTAGEVPGLGHPGMGITLQTLEEDIELPFDVILGDQHGIGGPSAGLMIALTTYDLLAEEDLTDGRRIAGTGTIDGDARVGAIGSIREKVLTAIEADVDLLLVPGLQVDDARAAARGRLEVVGVDTFDEAIRALRR